MSRPREEVANLLCNYDSLWQSYAVMLSREERYTQNLRLVEEWRSTSLVDKLEKYQELFS
jgi:hypothetical protein